MIITKNWLNEWVNLSGVTTEDICKTLNKIGLEVAGVTSYSIVENCVVGFIETKLSHPDAEKLSICLVDVGRENPLQIVCGAKNVAEGQFVPVALVGCKLPNGLEIKEAELRGAKSSGMICSSLELGYPKTNDGIFVLDNNSGELRAGMPLISIPEFRDDAIEIELTPNRGDCLSIHGIARDLAAVYNAKLKTPAILLEDMNQIGIGRVLNLNIEGVLDSSLLYKVLYQKELRGSAVMDLRLAIAGISAKTIIEKHLAYATHSTGVIFRAYKQDAFSRGEGEDQEKINITVKKGENNLDEVIGHEHVSYIGVSQSAESKPSDDDEVIIIEASYANPEQIARDGARNIKDADEALFRSLRGSEPDLHFGINYLSSVFNSTSNVGILTGVQQSIRDKAEQKLSVDFDDMSSIIGIELYKNDVINILKNLGFSPNFNPDQNNLTLLIPHFRHDVVNVQDICEEIVRMVGIDNIKAKPLKFAEANRFNRVYQGFEKRKFYRHKAVSAGFFESVQYIFADRSKQEFYGFASLDEKLELLNPITVELNTLRTTCAINLIEAVGNNVKNGKKSVNIFEVGKIFDKNRDEKTVISFISSGEREFPNPSNHGKPLEFDFASFVQKVGVVLGDFEITPARPEDKFYSPYEYGNIVIEGKSVGTIGRVAVEKEFGLGKTYICEVLFDKLPYGRKLAKPYSKLPSVSRDLSLLVPKTLGYNEIEACLKERAPQELKDFYPIDVYTDDSLGDNKSLTLTFVFEPNEKTFTDDEINVLIEQILESLFIVLKVAIR